jgi:L,D-transpeptidase catalytic domain
MSRPGRLLIRGIFCLLTFSMLSGNGSAAVEVAAKGRAAAAASIRRDPQPFAARIDEVAAQAAGVSQDVLKLAFGAVACATSSGEIAPPPTLTLIDYSRPSTEPRLWVFDMQTGTLLFKELVAHGRNTGDNMAVKFSDAMDSHQSSLGLFVTRDTYVGSNGYSLRLDGLEPGFNAHARERAIVMHGAPYVDASIAARQGRLGRSWGCPALREAVAHRMIDTVRGGGVVFSYYPDSTWLKTSRFLNGCGGAATVVAAG